MKDIIEQETADQPQRVSFSLNSIILIALIVIMVFTHLYGLSEKPLHHDESIHANSSYRLFKGQGYSYDPVYHGPFLYYATAGIYFLFGVNDVTSRLLPALCGLGIFFLLAWYFMKDRTVRDNTVLWVLLFLILSPTLTYFSRFLRMDLLSCFFATLLFIAALKYLKTMEAKYFLVMAAAMSLLYCTKENAHITAFIFCSFPFLFLVHHLHHQSPTESGRYGFFSRERREHTITTWLIPHQTLVKGILLFGVLEAGVVLFVLMKLKTPYQTFSQGAQQIAAGVFALVFIMAFLGVFVLLERFFLKREGRSESALSLEAFTRNESLFFGLMILIMIFLLFYTNFLNSPDRIGMGLFGGLEYWFGQQESPRIPGPFLYYVPIILLYELPFFIIAVIGVFAGGRFWFQILGGLLILLTVVFSLFFNVSRLYTLPFVHSGVSAQGVLFILFMLWLGVGSYHSYLRRHRVLEAFLLYWFVNAFFLYGLANEKVPWLTSHLMLPLVILSGVIIGRYFKEKDVRTTDPLVPLLVAIGCAFLLHNTTMLNFYNESDPREMMVYVQSHEQVKKVEQRIRELWFDYGEPEPFKIIADKEFTWPLAWYLRDFNVTWLEDINRIDAHVLITAATPKKILRDELDAKGFIGHRYKLRAWWIADWKKFYSLPVKKRLVSIRNYLLYRETFGEKPASFDFMYFYRPPWMDFVLSRKGGEGVDPETPASQDLSEPDFTLPDAYTLVSGNSLAQFGKSTSRQENVNHPTDCEIGPNGDIYVVDAGNCRIQVYSAEGTWKRQIGSGKGSGAGQMNDPQGVAIDAAGFVYIADTWNHRVLKFDPDGKYLMQFGQNDGMWGPRDVEVGPDENIYITDTGHTMIRVYSNIGKKVRTWGFKGSDPGKFDEPVGIGFLSTGDIAVADCGNKRVQLFDKNGNFQSSFTVEGWDNYYSEPYLAVDFYDRIYVSDADHHRILVFSAQGKLLKTIGGEGEAAGKLRLPKGIAINEKGDFVVTEVGNNRIQIFSSPFDSPAEE